MKILHTADWHIGTFKGPEQDGVNLRSLDTKGCLDAMVEKVRKERTGLVLVSGDIFHTGLTWSNRCCDEIVTAVDVITRLSKVAGHVVIMRGTPNHDGEGQFRVLDQQFAGWPNVDIVTVPTVVRTEYADIAVIPGFDKGEFRARFPGMGNEEENGAFTAELSNIVMGLRTQCAPWKPAVLMAHYTVPGCNMEGGQVQMLTQFEPVITAESLMAAQYDLVALGHIHRPQAVQGFSNVYYSGSINANNFNDEGQERGFWMHDLEPGRPVQSTFHKTPYREFLTIHLNDADITAINQGRMDEVAMNYWRWDGAAAGKIVRILYQCSAENKKAFHDVELERILYEDGAFYVADIIPEKVEEAADRTDLSGRTDPEGNLRTYLEEKGMEPDVVERLILKARPMISAVMAGDTATAFSGMFTPVEIEVRNYRAYTEEKFSFTDIQFCTINGPNGAGKSSLFMDAIIDCLYEEPREGKSTSVKVPWLRNEENVRSGYISFTFSVGEKTYRVVRTRAKSGKGTLALAELMEGEWHDRSQEKFGDTQDAIDKIIGVDSMTFRSCALIMQDQYDLFLKAKKDERMVILGNLLGLGIYGEIEDTARSVGAMKKRAIDEKKVSIETQRQAIRAAGDPEAELAVAEKDMQEIEQQLQGRILEKESTAIQLTSKKEAQERREGILKGIYSLKAKKRATEENMDAEKQIIQSCDDAMADEEELLEKAALYRELAEKEKALIEGETLYSQTSGLDEAIREYEGAQGELNSLNGKLEEGRTSLRELSAQEGEENIRAKAAEYGQKKKLLDEAYEKERAYRSLEQQLNRARYERSGILSEHEKAMTHISLMEQEHKKKAALLENVECVDIGRANCGFLSDAIASQKALETFHGRYEAQEAEKERNLAPIDAEIEGLQGKIQETGFDEGEVERISMACAQLKPYTDMLEALDRRENQAAILRASIENIQDSICQAEARLSVAGEKVRRLTREREKYREAHEAHVRITALLDSLQPWLEKERQLPVIKERRANAIRRRDELCAAIAELDEEISGKQDQAERELLASGGLDEMEERARYLQIDIESLNRRSKDLQISIGGLKQKIEEIGRVEGNIRILAGEIEGLAEEAADYEMLRLSFSQDGIPHQIVRTVIPKLAATANSILSQMTGGQLGVEFRTEKVLKSNSRKEVVTLDIFIEEHGKPALPYLSKSGGEKVKASLSVVLALAEIKASTMGVQFGMLFIDEPPFLDSDGIQAYCDALETIRMRYKTIKIMAITHDPTMKARFPQNLDVIVTDAGSKVLY